jgi:AcrR family transcriptional regulator
VDRRERRHSETRDEILQAARELVDEKGAAGMSLREVAKRTGFTPGALYRYFPGGKVEVVSALVAQVVELLGDHMRRVPTDLPPDERLIELGLVYLEFAREHPDALSLIVESVAALEDVDVTDPNESILASTSVFAIIDEAMRAGVTGDAAGALSDDDYMLMWHGAWAFLHGIAIIERVHPHHERLYRTRARDLLQLYVNGLKTDWMKRDGDGQKG